VTLLSWRPARACAPHVWNMGLCIGAVLVLAVPALSDNISANSSGTWQWNGSSWSLIAASDTAATATAPSPSLDSLSSSASTFAASPSTLAASISSTTPLATTSAVASGTATVSGFVYVDTNNDGIIETNDWAVMDARVSLTKSDGTGTPIVVCSGKDGAYTFSGVAPGDYSVTLLTSSNQPGKETTGTVRKNGIVVATILGTDDSFLNISLEDGDSGAGFDFAQLAYPVGAYTKRIFMGDNPGILHTVPEPGSLVLLAIAGLFLGGLAWRSRRVKIG
jgi:hypothetical protein